MALCEKQIGNFESLRGEASSSCVAAPVAACDGLTKRCTEETVKGHTVQPNR